MFAAFSYIISLLAGLSAFFFALSLLPSKSLLSEQLEELKMRDPLKRDETRLPVLERMFDTERRIALAHRLVEAGWYTTTPGKFLLRVAAGALAGAFFSLLVWRFFDLDANWTLPLMLMLAFVGGYSPFFLLNAACEKRKSSIQKALPEFLDMVSSTVTAGLALNSALGYAVEAVTGPLSEEIREALSEIRLGRARADALKAVGERTNHPALRNALRVMTQAERLGANIAKMLNDLADDARHQRLMLVEEMAAKLPVKMVFPMVFFMIPAIITIIFGAVAANYFAGKP
ncbi:MAG: type II secretion system F family protein [Candidatus Eremiobacteraeota bacterium]|nr:type II secretion system F family protein [Candidatus Eremiobacteraeota bacterium]MBV8499281.1 type II secretion system F family protein [Candidatus Eremiobacteraeota bacterium]